MIATGFIVAIVGIAKGDRSPFSATQTQTRRKTLTGKNNKAKTPSNTTPTTRNGNKTSQITG